MAITIQHKRDTAANWTSNNPTLAAGEFGFETDTGKLKLGDGSTAWSSLGYFETAAPSGPSYSPTQGSSCGFAVGGISASTPASSSIDTYPFTSDANATCVGALLYTSDRRGAGSVSSTHGYLAGGTTGGTTIQKFPFSISSSTATDVADLTAARGHTSGATSSTNGYAAGGDSPTAAPRGSPTGTDRIDKFPFSSDTNATDVGCLLSKICRFGGSSSPSHGYVLGGYGSNKCQTIEKFTFASDANSTSVGSLITGTGDYGSGHSSDSAGYYAGGGWPITPPPGIYNNIQKVPFSSDADATDVADLSAVRSFISGQSSTTHGYVTGGYGSSFCNQIEKFSFPSDANATDVGDLTLAIYGGASHIAT